MNSFLNGYLATIFEMHGKNKTLKTQRTRTFNSSVYCRGMDEMSVPKVIIECMLARME